MTYFAPSSIYNDEESFQQTVRIMETTLFKGRRGEYKVGLKL